jgi:hypothetical protein
VKQLFTIDFSQKVQASEDKTNSRSKVISFLKKQKGEQLNCKQASSSLSSQVIIWLQK